MATDSTIKKILGLLDTADTKIGYLMFALNKPDRAWLKASGTADKLVARLRNLINTCEAAISTIEVHTRGAPVEPPKPE